MKNLVLAILIGFTLISCTKDNNSKTETEINSTELIQSSTMNELSNYIQSEKKRLLENIETKSLEISNLENPYNNVGYLHNVCLDYFNSNGGIDNYTIDLALLRSKQYYGITCNLTTNEYISRLSTLLGNLYSDDFEYQNDFVNSLTDISQIEKGFLNMYFTEVDSISSIEIRVELSKSIEKSILESTVISNDSKSRLLRTFSIYRYSTFFWYNYSAASKVRDYRREIADIVDALSEHWATHSEHEVGVFEDGSDVNEYSATVSLTAYILIGI
jgi:hypothetical protein